MKRTKNKWRHSSVTELSAFSQALDNQFGKDRPKLKPGPKPQPEKRYVKTFIKLHPQIVAWARRRAKILHIGYQTVINQTLLASAVGKLSRTKEVTR